MPNGGSDCCMTCSFNKKNKGEAGYKHVDDPESDYCTIRSLPIANPACTYCSNHPLHNSALVDVPIGPVWHDPQLEGREILVESPDTEVIRQGLLKLLDNIDEAHSVEYVSGPAFDDMVIVQLGVFGERRAIPKLERISKLQPQEPEKPPKAILGGVWARPRQQTVALAREVLTKLRENS